MAEPKSSAEFYFQCFSCIHKKTLKSLKTSPTRATLRMNSWPVSQRYSFNNGCPSLHKSAHHWKSYSGATSPTVPTTFNEWMGNSEEKKKNQNKCLFVKLTRCHHMAFIRVCVAAPGTLCESFSPGWSFELNPELEFNPHFFTCSKPF